ncbi:hypothetical protein [Leucothrix arctica]|uniref:Uncharacterized protein n=1 Tax=Leucothrix arctica TaxID=1481894 RepID=A0A317CAN4_9GAMM|nr:hypothetical protein [Leucothrix arctica]PWQ95745.1 hypothetical protein DKT75_11975 [Leucothrix arctica]
MRKLFSILFVLTASGFYSSLAHAATSVINCPVTQARVQMTTGLLGGWWRTPYVNNLQGTAVQMIGGKRTLVCKYGNHAAFWTMRLEPTTKICQPRSRDFLCKDKVQPARTLRTGPLVIPQTYLVDLDYGQVRSQGADIWFQAQTATRRFITPRNGATIGIAGTRSVGRDGCKNRTLRAIPIPLPRIPVGSYVCVKTNEGRYAQFRVNRAAGASPGNLHIGYTTWRR